MCDHALNASTNFPWEPNTFVRAASVAGVSPSIRRASSALPSKACRATEAAVSAYVGSEAAAFAIIAKPSVVLPWRTSEFPYAHSTDE